MDARSDSFDSTSSSSSPAPQNGSYGPSSSLHCAPVYLLADGGDLVSFAPPLDLAPAVMADRRNLPDGNLHSHQVQLLPGWQQVLDRHIFLCYKDPQSWPSRVEASESDRLPRFLNTALKTSGKKMPFKTKLTLCEGRDGTESSNGDVLLFPDMVRYKGLTHFDVDTFVEEVLINNKEWPSGRPEKLSGIHIFICSHGGRDSRCGVCGPLLISLFKEEVANRGLEGHVFVRACSHIGGHKYMGNVIIYGLDAATGVVTGHCYGYVMPGDVSNLLDHLRNVAATDLLLRCQMESEDGDMKQQVSITSSERVEEEDNNKCSCCQTEEEEPNLSVVKQHALCSSPSICLKQVEAQKNEGYDSRGSFLRGSRSPRGIFQRGWFTKLSATWENEDTWALLALVGAAASVTLAYHSCKNWS